MGTEQYVPHDWSYVTLSLMLLAVVVVVFATMGLFLYQVARAGQTSSSPGVTDDQTDRTDSTTEAVDGAATGALPRPHRAAA